ncbi:KamA family radical SAM protein [Chloroflexota bacterium]
MGVATAKIKYIDKISDVPQLTPKEVRELEKVTAKFPFGANTYYLGLINWEDKADPIRRIVIPNTEELEVEGWRETDPSHEADYTVAPGLQHKYQDTALFLLSDLCGGRCRYCFRKRLFMEHREYEILKDYRPAVQYIREHNEINNVLLTGGDPLRLATSSLRHVLSALRQIDHVEIIRFGTKMPVYNPFRVIDDPEFPKLIKEFSTPEKRIYFMIHFSHPNEITKKAIEAVNILIESGAILCNQNPLLRGVNDSPGVLAELYKKLSFIGVSPYYTFQDRPAMGNKPYAVPLVRAYQIVQEATKNLSGTAKRATFSMSHALGKIEVVGLDDSHIYMIRYRTPNPEDTGKLMIARRNDGGYWLDDFEIVQQPEDLTGSSLPRLSRVTNKLS